MCDKNQIDINSDINNINEIYNKIVDHFTPFNI